MISLFVTIFLADLAAVMVHDAMKTATAKSKEDKPQEEGA